MTPHLISAILLAGISTDTPFEETSWLEADLAGRVRARMLPDLINRYGLVGMRRHEIITLLGQPAACVAQFGTELVYPLGNNTIDDLWLRFTIDDQDCVVSFRRSTGYLNSAV